MLKPICVPCGLFYRPKKNGFSFIECMPDNEENWKPYKLWNGDLWHCLGCHHEIVVGTGRNPIAERHDSDFAERIKREGAELRVTDC